MEKNAFMLQVNILNQHTTLPVNLAWQLKMNWLIYREKKIMTKWLDQTTI
jgi:hypothetical protein